jgi:hypothetical protein
MYFVWNSVFKPQVNNNAFLKMHDFKDKIVIFLMLNYVFKRTLTLPRIYIYIYIYNSKISWLAIKKKRKEKMKMKMIALNMLLKMIL